MLTFPEEALTLLWYLTKKYKIAMMINKECLKRCLNVMDANPGTQSFYIQWLGLFENRNFWNLALLLMPSKPYFIACFSNKDNIIVENQQLIQKDNLSVRVGPYYPENICMNIWKFEKQWIELKNHLAIQNGVDPMTILSPLMNASGYHHDGHI